MMNEVEDRRRQAAEARTEAGGRPSPEKPVPAASGPQWIDEQEAERLGRKFRRGGQMRAPVMDVYFVRWASKPGMHLVGLCAAWLRGWDKQNLELA